MTVFPSPISAHYAAKGFGGKRFDDCLLEDFRNLKRNARRTEWVEIAVEKLKSLINEWLIRKNFRPFFPYMKLK